MSEEPTETTQVEEETGGSIVYYVIGALIVVAIAAGVWLLRPKQAATQPAGITTPVVPTPTPGPIKGLACERQYYNPVVAFRQYFLSVEGVDLANVKDVDCTFTVSVAGSVVATASAQGELSAAPERYGQIFKCTTKKLELAPEVATLVNVGIKNDLGVTGTCSATFLLPKP